jgi:hypothetical protein
VYTANVNLLLYLLTKNGKIYYRTKIGGKRENAPNVNDLEKISEEKLYDKLTFVRENGLELISDVCDRHLRNSIAHMNIVIFDNGAVAYKGEHGKLVVVPKTELDTKIEKLLSVCQCISESMKKFYSKKMVGNL